MHPILASMVAPRNVPIHPLTDYGPEMSAGQQFFVGRFEESITRRPNRLRFHRHTYYEVFWINGRGGFFADFREYLIADPSHVGCGDELVHQVRAWFRGDVAELAILEGASEAPVCEPYGSSEQRAKIANSARPKGLS